MTRREEEEFFDKFLKSSDLISLSLSLSSWIKMKFYSDDALFKEENVEMKKMRQTNYYRVLNAEIPFLTQRSEDNRQKEDSRCPQVNPSFSREIFVSLNGK